MNTAANDSGTRLVELDILRALAILLVLGRHVAEIPDSLHPAIGWFFRSWREFGWLGVDLFFVLSGYLVSTLLFTEFQRTGKVRVGRFLIRRAFKIYPAFYCFLAASALTAHLLALPSRFHAIAFRYEALFIQNYGARVWNHTWSLAVEEHFYLVFALLMFALAYIQRAKPNPFRALPALILLLLLSVLGWRSYEAYTYPLGRLFGPLAFTHFRIDSLFFGVAIAYAAAFHRAALEAAVQRFAPVLCLFACAIFPAALYYSFFGSVEVYSFGFTLVYLAFGALLLLTLFSRSNLRQSLISTLAPLAHIGQQSYSIYLWHLMFYKLTARVFPPEASSLDFYIHTALYFACSIVMGSYAAKLIEAPALRLRERVMP